MANLNLDQVASNQNQKEVTINDAFGQVDSALTDRLALDLSTAGVTLTAAQWTRNWFFECTGHTVARTVILPATKRPAVVRNAGTGEVTLQVMGGGSAVVAVDQAVMIFNDGVNLAIVGGGSGPEQRWPPFSPPLASSLVTATGGATVFTLKDDADVGLQVTITPTATGDKVHAAYATLTDKSLDWELVARINTVLDPSNYRGIGIGFMDSISGRITHMAIDGRRSLYWRNLASLTSFGAEPKNSALAGDFNWLRIRSVGSTVYGDVSPDGKTWWPWYSAAATSYLTNRADRVGIFAWTNNAVGLVASCDYFALTGPAV